MPLAAVDGGGGGSGKRRWTRAGVVAGGGHALAVMGVVVDVAVDGEGDGNRVVVVKASETLGFDVLGLVAVGKLDETALAVCARYLKKKKGRRWTLSTL